LFCFRLFFPRHNTGAVQGSSFRCFLQGLEGPGNYTGYNTVHNTGAVQGSSLRRLRKARGDNTGSPLLRLCQGLQWCHKGPCHNTGACGGMADCGWKKRANLSEFNYHIFYHPYYAPYGNKQCLIIFILFIYFI
jgi:hypothetical protein